MGHDITAYRSGVDREALYEELDLHTHNDDWLDRYNVYREQVEIAYNRRSAASPLNQVIYLALGVMDEAYAGCSGNGAELDITREQLETARDILKSKNFSGMTRERNVIDDILGMFTSAGIDVTSSADNDDDVSTEREFVDRCLAYLDESGEPSLRIMFA
ncbi:MAG: hypothetical protein KDA89_00710 [Planctomycetaceae bacterium]|nr:hypothetical protein [Planctomycetaceae bacterium]